MRLWSMVQWDLQVLSGFLNISIDYLVAENYALRSLLW